jgi:hypothetical protein
LSGPLVGGRLSDADRFSIAIEREREEILTRVLAQLVS